MKNTKLLASFLLLGLFACKKNSTAPSIPKDLKLSAIEQTKAESDNAFSLKLFQEVIRKEDGGKNILVSPLSASIALGMTTNGANGETLQAMKKALQFPLLNNEEINSYYQKLIKELPELDPETKLKIANSIWYRNDFSVLDEFKSLNSKYFNASITPLDFKNQEGAKSLINNWVKEQTNNKIPAIVDDIREEDVMFLMNAVYFKGNWKYKFDKSKTTKQTFFTDNNGSVQADFMTTKATVKAGYAQQAQILELPYGNDKYSMVFIQPDNSQSLQSFSNSLTSEKWKMLLSSLRESTVDINVPKFKFDYKKILNDELSSLGMGVAFSGAADFSKINPDGGLQISKVLQKAFIEVNEEGTEAAAATSVGIVLTSAPAPLTINKPFVFAIREQKTGLILFIGQVNNPNL